MNQRLHAVDWAVIAVYLAVVAAIGFRVARGQRSTRDYFLGGRTLPWWAAALSIIATETSAVTYIGTPRFAFEGDWWFLQFVLGLVLGRIFLALYFIHVFYRREFVTVYGFLEQRFGPAARTTAASIFLIGRVIGSAVRLYAGCLALEVAAGISIHWAIIVLGVFGAIYTLAGGIKAVVWTDVLLGLTFMAGGLASAAYLLSEIPGGLSGLLSDPTLPQKTAIFHPSWDLSSPRTLLAGLAGGFFLTLATHGTDQDVAQRLLTCRDSRDGRRSVIGSAVLILPVMALFLVVGTLLYFFYAGRPGFQPPDNLDHVFPRFIVQELPAGFRGFVMAGLLAVAVSSFTSVLNALASTTVSDFFQPLARRLGAAPSERGLLRLSRGVTLFWASLLIALAMAFHGSSQNLLIMALSVLAYFYGALLGSFLLGIFTRRGSAASVVAGMLASVPLVLLFQFRQYLDRPESAPAGIRGLLGLVPQGIQEPILRFVPDIAWPYWIILGTAVTLGIGALARGPGVAAEPTS